MYSCKLNWATLCAVAAAILFGHPARAFDQWDIAEIFSNADGTVQFVELFTTADNQGQLFFHALEATSDGSYVAFTIENTVSNFTANKRLLFATAGFAQLTGGVAPDYTPLPPMFFNPNATSITLRFGHGSADEVTFSGAQLPKDGVNSLHDTIFGPTEQSFIVAVNSPTNFAGQAGQINLGTGGGLATDFDGNNAVNGADLRRWGDGFGLAVGANKQLGDANVDGDVDGQDFLNWQKDFGRTASVAAGAGVPEPRGVLMAALGGGLLMLAVHARNRRQAAVADFSI